MNAGFVAKVDKSTMTVNIVRIVYGGIEPHAVSRFVISFYGTLMTFKSSPTVSSSLIGVASFFLCLPTD